MSRLALGCALTLALWGCDHGRALTDTPPDGGAPDLSVTAPAPDAGLADAPPLRETKWEQLGTLSAERPPGRMNHFAVYDPDKDRLLVLGGYDPYKPEGGCCVSPYHVYKDVWQLELQSGTWTRLGDLDAPLLAFMPIEVALDRAKSRLVIVGAVQNENYGPAKNLALDLTSWKTTALPTGPWSGSQWPLRVAFDEKGGRVIVHGAYTTSQVEGVWALDLKTDTWSPLSTASHPSFRYHAPLTGAARGRALLFAGYTGETAATDLWELDVEAKTWRELTLPTGLRGRWSHRAVYDAARDTLVVFGGDRHGSKDLLETLLIHRATLQVTEPTLSPTPERRRDHSLVLDSRRRRALVYGGAFESKHVFDDVWALQLP